MNYEHAAYLEADPCLIYTQISTAPCVDRVFPPCHVFVGFFFFFSSQANKHPELIPRWPDWSTWRGLEVGRESMQKVVERCRHSVGPHQKPQHRRNTVQQLLLGGITLFQKKRTRLPILLFFSICRFNHLANSRCANCFSPRRWHSRWVYWPATASSDMPRGCLFFIMREVTLDSQASPWMLWFIKGWLNVFKNAKRISQLLLTSDKRRTRWAGLVVALLWCWRNKF